MIKALFLFYGLNEWAYFSSWKQWTKFYHHLHLKLTDKKQSAPAINIKSWRKRLVDQPGEIEAIEAGMYE